MGLVESSGGEAAAFSPSKHSSMTTATVTIASHLLPRGWVDNLAGVLPTDHSCRAWQVSRHDSLACRQHKASPSRLPEEHHLHLRATAMELLLPLLMARPIMVSNRGITELFTEDLLLRLPHLCVYHLHPQPPLVLLRPWRL